MAEQQQPQQPGTPPTPAGQAGAGTNGPNMSQLVMQMMAQLTQGQTQLNQAMTEAMNQQLQINRNVERSVEYKDRSELKGIPKPDKFNGASGMWDSWWYKFKTWVESCHKNAVKIVAQVEAQCDKEITELNLQVDFDDGAELVSAQARQALISLTEGEALEIVKNTSRGSHFGLEAMRRLLCKYDPQNPQANAALLKKVLHPSQCSLDKLREGLESWENLKRKYEERRKKPLEDDICRSCLQQMCPNKLQDHLDLQASRLTSYDQVKSEVLAYIENVETRKEAKSGAVPMDVDSLAKSKGKEKSDKGKGKGKSKGKDKGKSGWNTQYSKGSSSWQWPLWNQQSWQKNSSKGKGKKDQDKGKGKGDQGKGRRVSNVESDARTQEQQPSAASTGDQPEPEVTALYTLEETMSMGGSGDSQASNQVSLQTLKELGKRTLIWFYPKPRKLEPKRHRGGHHRSERRRQDEARKKENLAKMSEMQGERTPPWVHDRYERSETQSATASGEDDFVNKLDRLQQDPAVRHKLDKVLKEAYEETYGEPYHLDSPEMVESDFDVPMADEPAPGMEDVVHHWEIAQKEIIPFKDLHEKSKTVSRMGHSYVKCQACGKALNSLSIASFWQHVESKQCYPQSAIEFWKKEHRQMSVEEKESSSKRPMDDSEALSEKKLQQMAKEKEEKKRKDIFSGHLERFKKHPKEDVKPEVKRIPKRPEEKQAEKSEPIVLRPRSPSRQPEGRRADSAQAPKGMGKVSIGAKRFLTRAVLEAAKDVRRHAKKPRPTQEEKEKKEEKVTSSPKSKGSPHGDEASSGSHLDFIGNLSAPVNTIVWATVDSGAATNCLPQAMCKNLELNVKPVDEKPFTNASGHPVPVYGTCSPMVVMGEQNGPRVKGVGTFRAMDVAKPLLSVSKMVEHGWTVHFGPEGSYIKRGIKKIPVVQTGGVFKIAMDFHGQPTEGLTA